MSDNATHATTGPAPITLDTVLDAFYRGVLGRKPDRDGLAFYRTQVRSGRYTLADVLAEMLDSPEYKARHGTGPSAPAAPAGPAGPGKVKGALGRLGARAGLFAGARPWERDFPSVATEEDIFYCFRLLLGRRPNRVEWPGHASRVGADLAGVVASYLGSQELARRRLGGPDPAAMPDLRHLPGFDLFASRDDLDVGKEVIRGTYEPDVTSVFRRFVAPGMGVVDVGANIGYFTHLAAALVGPDGFVLAIEPNSDNMRLLEASRRANGFAQVVPALCAAGRDTGLLALNVAHSNGMTSALPDDVGAILGARLVPCFRLDDLIPAARRIDFVKIDVEGAEYNALLGARDTLARCRPVIVSEFNPYLLEGVSGTSGEGYLRFLLDHGYSLCVVGPDGALADCGADTAAVLAAYEGSGRDHIDIVAQPVAPR